MKSAWATISSSATATGCVLRCSGVRTATPDSRAPIRSVSIYRRSWTRYTAINPPTSKPSRAIRARCSAGPSACSPCARPARRLGAARADSCGPATARSSRTCASSAKTTSSVLPTCRVRLSRWSSIWLSSKAACRWKCWDAPPFLPSAICRTCSPSQPSASTGSGWPPTPKFRHGTNRSCRSKSVRCWCCSTGGPACSGSAWCRGASASPRRPVCSSRPIHCRATSRRSAGMRPKARGWIGRASRIICCGRKARRPGWWRCSIWSAPVNEPATSCRSHWPGRSATRNGCATCPRRRWPRYASRRMSGSWATPLRMNCSAVRSWRPWRRARKSPWPKASCNSGRRPRSRVWPERISTRCRRRARAAPVRTRSSTSVSA